MANHVLLRKIRLTSAASSVTFANIPQSGYSDLKIVISARNDRGSQGPGYLRLQFNGVTTGYSRRIIWTSTDDGNIATQAGSDDYISFGVNTNFSTANTFCNGEIYISNAFSSNAKSVSADFVSETNSAFNAAIRSLTTFNSTNTNAISSIALLNDGTNFVAGSTFSIYGVAATGTSATTGPKASGGNIVATDGTYWYHAFLTSGFFAPIQTLSCDALVVAGGGGGGAFHGGGGGGGAIEGSSFFQTQNLSATNYPVTIGAGGSGGTVGGRGSQGNSSLFYGTSTITALGGGGGGSAYVIPTAGGSGGGTGQSGHSAGAASGSNTNAGGTSQGNGQGGGGGGGATGAGANANNNTAGGGGQGKTLTTIDANLSVLGFAGIVASSGGGGGSEGGSAASGGTGAGSGTSNNTAGGNATSFGSGGGGGGYVGGDGGNGGNGASGIIIVRYAV